ncbi:MAG: pectate lyase [Luteolibacter sp.]
MKHPLRSALLVLTALAPLSAFAAGGGAAAYLKKPDGWFSTADAEKVATTILSYQSDLGGWPKNTDTVDAPYTGDRGELHPTFDNGATTDELRFLARCYDATKDEVYQRAFSKGLGYILKAQYPNGGWPQYYPPSQQYHRYITFNDGAMERLMGFLREVNSKDTYAFVPAKERKAAGEAFDKGIECILKCQIKMDGKLTVWCAQHDEVDFSPRKARAFELASFSGAESAGLTRLLMSLDKPSPEVVKAVDGAVAWFEAAQIKGIRLERKPDPSTKKGTNLVVVQDRNGSPLWARFYDLKTGKPLFCDRDGVPKSSVAEIGSERRNGYAWYGTWPQQILEKEYPEWKKRNR